MAGNTHASTYYSPSFLKEKTPEQLELSMLTNNIKEARVYDYYSVQFANGFWYAWYNRDQTNRVKTIRKSKRTN